MPLKRSVFLGHLPQLKRDPVQFLTDASRTGDTVPLYLPRLAYLLNDPESVKRVLGENHANYRKGAISRRLKVFLGDGLLTSEGNWWRYQRRLLQPLFQREHIEKLVPIIRESTEECLAQCSKAAAKGGVDIHAEMTRVTTLIIGRIVLGVDLLTETDHLAKAVRIGLQLAQQRELSLLPLPLWVPTPANVRVRSSRDAVYALIEREIDMRGKVRGRGEDILSMLMNAQDDQGHHMTRQQIRDQAVTLLMAGHVTTATALSWLIFLISKHTECQERIATEARSVLTGEIAQSDELARLKYTRACFYEGLRLYPPSWLLHREAMRDDTVKGVKLKAGTNVLISPYLLHRHPDYWDRSDQFDPTRFDKGHEERKFLYIPFGAGPRFCIGAQLAEMEAQIILASIVKKFRVRPGSSEDPKPVAAITLRPAGPISVILEDRGKC